MTKSHGPLRIGVGGPVGSGKTALMDLLCKAMRGRYDIAAITNDIYTKWDAEFLVRSGSLTPDRIVRVASHGSHFRRRARRLSAYSDPGRCLDEPGGGGRHAREIPGTRSGIDRI